MYNDYNKEILEKKQKQLTEAQKEIGDNFVEIKIQDFLKEAKIKDVFIDKKKGLIGAPASVHVLDENTDINDKAVIEAMQETTKILNLPISCFVKKAKGKNEFDIRYFIAEKEEDTCGHGTIATSKVLSEIDDMIEESKKDITFNLLQKNSEDKKGEKHTIETEINNNGLISMVIEAPIPEKVDENDPQWKKVLDTLFTNNKNVKVIQVVKGIQDFTVEVDYEGETTAEDVMKSMDFIFPHIELIKLNPNDKEPCRGIDVVVKNKEKQKNEDPDYYTRILLPYGASEEFKEDPACGSGSAYVTSYLANCTNHNNSKKELILQQMSKNGALITTKYLGGGKVKVSGQVIDHINKVKKEESNKILIEQEQQEQKNVSEIEKGNKKINSLISKGYLSFSDLPLKKSESLYI